MKKAVIRNIKIPFLFAFLLVPSQALSQDFTAKSFGDYGNVTVMEVSGNYNAKNADGTNNATPRQAIAQEFFKTHKDEYDFLVIFTNFDFQMPEGEAKAFYEGVKNDTQGIGMPLFDNTALYGSSGLLQGTVDMGNVKNLVTDPLDPKFEETLYMLSHEMLHRWAAQAKFKDATGAVSSALLGQDGAHWSYLLDSGGSVLYGNQWQDNKNGTFTSTIPQSRMLFYSQLDLYLMGMIERDKVHPMLLINSSNVDPTQLPQSGVTITGTAQYVTIDQIIAAMGPRVPDTSSSQKNFKTAFIFAIQPGTFTGNELYDIENVRNGLITRFSVLTDGTGIMEINSILKDIVPTNPGIVVPPLTPRTLPPNINDGVTWLMTNQKSDGSWADLGQTAERDTAEATQVLKNFTASQINYQNGLQWLDGMSSGNMDFLSRKIQTLPGSGQDLTSLLADILFRQNVDGGWGSDRSYASNPMDTALALKALAVAGSGDSSVISKAIEYLKSEQNTDGGWGNEDKGSTVQETSNVLSVFNQYRGAYQFDGAIARGMVLLASRQNSDGGFGNSPSTVYDTATALMTLRELNTSIDTTNKALTYLLGQQSDNGSWGQSAYQTALAVEAVYKATVDPDLSLNPEDITFIPAKIQSLPTNVVINANIWNLGLTTVAQAKVALYDGDPVLGNKIGEQVLAFGGQQATTMTFSAAVNDGSEHVYTIVADPDNIVKEANKLNNIARKTLVPEATYDFEVLPSNIAVSANPVDMFKDVTVSAKIMNKGAMNAYNVQVKYYIDDPAAPFEVATRTVDIPAGATITHETTWHANKAGVDLPLAIFVDPFNTFTELSETNNKASTLITVNALTQTDPNVTVSYKDIVITPRSVCQGGSVTISALIKNEGGSPANNIVVNVYRGVPGQDGLLLGTQTIPSLAPGENANVTADWTDIQETGEKIIYVQAALDSLIKEISKDDNAAFTTLNILTLPDLGVSTDSIVFNPPVPQSGNKVLISINVQNTGDQDAVNVPVAITEGNAEIASQIVPTIPGNYWKIVSFEYDSTGKTGSHDITVTIDPENTIPETSKSNNRATRAFAVLDSTLSVTEPYISPNGDGVKDSTQFSFVLDAPQTVTVAVVNKSGKAIRTFGVSEFTNTMGGTIAWDGLNDNGTVADDGQYRIQVLDLKGNDLKSSIITVDNNRSAFAEAIGTRYLLSNEIGNNYSGNYWRWFPDDTSILMQVYDPTTQKFGLYVLSTDGKEKKSIVPAAWSNGADPNYDYSTGQPIISPKGDKIAFTLGRWNRASRYTDQSQLWTVNPDGTNLTLIDTSTLTSGYYGFRDIHWSPDGKFIDYQVNLNSIKLWIARSDGSGKIEVDSVYSPSTISPQPKWFPDSQNIAYYVTSGYSWHTLRIADTGGNKKDIATLNGYDYIVSFDPLSNQRTALVVGNQLTFNQSLSIIDANGNKQNIVADGRLGSTGSVNSPSHIKKAPDEQSFAFSLHYYNSNKRSLYVSDNEGNAYVAYECENASADCLDQALVWSPDGGKIAFFSGYASGYFPDGKLVVVEPKTGKATTFSDPHLHPQLSRWQAEGTAIIACDNSNNYNHGCSNIYSINTQSGEIISVSNIAGTYGAVYDSNNGGVYSLDTGLLSPRGTYITYETFDGNDIIRYRLWALSSLLNLPATLKATRGQKDVVLSGMATDLNFGGYQLEYADTNAPDSWNSIAPPSNTPVVNDVFVRWVPPHGGDFDVRLTAWDQAGNVATRMQRVSWGEYSSITDLSLNYDTFSPNNDGIKDTVELHYRVTEAINLDFNIYDNDGNLITTMQKSQLSPAQDYILWDGRDSSGRIVPDGTYKIKVLTSEMSVVIDSVPPDIHVEIGPISQGVYYFEDDLAKRFPFKFPYVDILGHVVDVKIKEWTLEYGEGANPQDWHEVTRGSDQVVKKVENGSSVPNPLQNTTVFTYKDPDVAWLKGKKFRITAEDFGGNKSSSISGFIPEQVLLYQLDNSPVSIQDDEVTAIRRGAHTIGIKETIGNPLAALTVQYEENNVWFDSHTVSDPGAGVFTITWDNSLLNPDYDHRVRIKAVDILGNAYYSNSVMLLKYAQFNLEFHCGQQQQMLDVTNVLQENLASLQLQFMSVSDPDHKTWTDFHVYDSARGDVVPQGLFTVNAPNTKYGIEYSFRMIGRGISGIIYKSAEILNKCGVTLKLYVYPYKFGFTCNETTQSASISAGFSDPDGSIGDTSNATLKIFIFRDGAYQLFRQMNQSELMRDKSQTDQAELTPDGPGDHVLNTAVMPEGKYPVKAVLSYVDSHDHFIKEKSDTGMLIVDRTLPTAQITSPLPGQRVCLVNMGGWYGVPISGIIADDVKVKNYALLFREYYPCNQQISLYGEEQSCTAETRKGDKLVEIAAGGLEPNVSLGARLTLADISKNGEIGTWDVTDLSRKSNFTLNLVVQDINDNLSCSRVPITLAFRVSWLDIALDRNVFSPNGDNSFDDVNINYNIDANAAVRVQVFKINTAPDGSSSLSPTPLRTITVNQQMGTGSIAWNGKDDAGSVVPDGKYELSIQALDVCDNSTVRTFTVEVDTTFPVAVIAYPKTDDVTGNIVDVQGTANDLHLRYYTLEAGKGYAPDAWTLIVSKAAPVQNDVLGTWKTFELEGIWTLKLTVGDAAGNKTVTTVVVDVKNGLKGTLIKNLTVSPGLFSPNNDGKRDTADVLYELTDACNVKIEFFDGGGAVKKTYSTTAPSSGVYAYAWDGRDNTGSVVADGTYTTRLTAILSSNTAVSQAEAMRLIIDTAPPLVDIARPANNSYIGAADLAVSGTISDLNMATYSIVVTGPTGTPTLLDQANQSRTGYGFGMLSNMPEGNYSLTAKSTDLGQNETSKTINFTIQRTPPAVKLDAPQDGEYYGANKNITISGSIVESSLDAFNLRYGAGDSPAQWTNLITGTTVTAYPASYAWKVGKNDGVPDGVYTLSLFAKNKAGLTGETRVKAIVDNTQPAAAITSPRHSDYVRQSTDVKGTAFDQNLDKYSLEMSEGQCADAFKWAPIKTATTTVQDNVLGTWQALPTDGNYCLRLSSADKVGLTAEARVNVKVDTHPPAAPVLLGTINNKTSASLTWTANTESDVAGYNLYRNDQKINTSLLTDLKYLDQNLPDGSYAYTVKAQDFAGWESLPSSEITLKVDFSGPAAGIRYPQDGARVNGLIDVQGTAYSVDDFKQYRIYIGQGASPASWTLIRTSPVPVSFGSLAQWNTMGLTDGGYSIRLETEDVAGNINTYQIAVTIDTAAPGPPVLVSAADNGSNITITWNPNVGTEPAGYLVYRNDRLVNAASGANPEDWKQFLLSCTAYIDKALPDGAFTYSVVAMGPSGNMSGRSNTIEVFLDTHAPHAGIVSPTDGSKIGDTISVKAETPDFDIASVQFQIQSAQTTSTWSDLGSSVTTSPYVTYLDMSALGLAYGDYRLRAVAIDQGQKSDASPGYFTVTYTDLKAPAAPQGLVIRANAGVVTLAWNANAEDDFAGYNVYRTFGGIRTKLNAALIVPSQQPAYQNSGVADGSYIYDVTAVDTHDNESMPSNQASARIYAPAIAQSYTPTAQSVVQLQGSSAVADGTVSLFRGMATGLVSLGTATTDATGAFTMNAALIPGENRLSARITDSAGNISKDSNVVVVVYDIAPGAPTGVTASGNASAVHLVWNANPETGVLGYNIYRDGSKANKSVDLAMSSTSVFASSMPSYHAPSAAVDSSLGSYWSPANGVGGGNTAWWETDFAQELISHVEIHWGTDVDISGNEITYAGKDYEVQVWSGYAWITQAKVVGNTAKDNIFDFKPSYRTNRIRIFITDSTDINSAKQVRLAEVGIIKDALIPKIFAHSPAYDDLNLMNKKYSYTVTAVDNYGFESGLSSEVTATVSITPPDRPAGLNVGATPEGGLNVSWTYSGNASAGYRLSRGLTSGGPYSKVNSATISGTSYLDMGLMSGVTYFYVLTAVDSVGNEGAYSNEASGIPYDLVPPSKPVICFPAIAGQPVALSTDKTDIYGSADPGSAVDLFGNGVWIGRTVAQPNDSVRNVPLNYDQLGAAVSPDGKTLVYSYGNKIWLTSFATGTTTQILQASGSSTFAWSFDSKKIAYTYYDSTGRRRVGIYDVPSGSSAPLTSDTGVSESYPTWSPDGSKMAYVQSGGASVGVKIRDLLSGAVVQATNSSAAGHPVFSPDGGKLAYFDSLSLKLYDIAGNSSKLIDDNTDATALEWSSDGGALAFVSNRNGNGDVYILDIPSGNQVLVPGSVGRPHYLTWTSDGKYVLFDIWDSSKNRDTLWMADFRAQTPPQQIMPDLLNVWYAGSAKTGAMAFIDRNAQGAYSANLLNRAGSFLLSAVSLAPGGNIFTAEATDAAGNMGDPSDSISVTFDTQSTPDLTILPDDVYLYPPCPIAGEQMAVNAVVSNRSQTDVLNLDVAVYVWNALGQLELLKADRIPSIAAGLSALISGTWDSAGKAGPNRLVVVIDADDTIPESLESNNMAIKDFYVADHAGMVMNTKTDAPQYGSNQNANLAVTVWNTGPAADAVLDARIEDANGNPVLTYDTRTISLAYGAQSIQNFVWNTGSTYAGLYVVHVVLKDTAGAKLSENSTPFTIIPDAAVDLSVMTNKLAYGPGENVVTSFTIRNTGVNYIIPPLQATISIADAAGASVFSEVKNISHLMPGSFVGLSSSWNTGLAAPGNYHATVTVSFDGGPTASKAASFTINALMVLTGDLTAFPSVVPVGNSVQLTYTITNEGNIDTLGCTARISIIDPETQTVIQTRDEAVDLAENSRASGKVMVNTNGYGLKTYTAVLQFVYEGTTKNIANASFTVKDLIPPVVTVITPAASGTYSSTITISAFAIDNVSGVESVEYQVDSSIWKLLTAADPTQGRYSTTWNPTPAENGPHAVYFRATDKAGNISTPVPVIFTIQTDIMPPVLTLSTLPDGAYTNKDTLNITGTATDDAAVQGVTINDTAVAVNADGTFSHVLSLTSGTNGITTVAADTAGNTTTDARTITLDQAAPAITVTNPADNSITNRLNFMVTGTVDKTAAVTVAMNDRNPLPADVTDAGFSLPVALEYGRNTIQVTAIDLAGNTGVAKRTVTFDDQNPSLSVTYPAEDMTTGQQQMILTGEVSDLTAITVTVAVDGNVLAPAVIEGKFEQTITFADQKTYQINVTAVDEVGNQSLVQRNVIYNAIPQNFGVFGATGVSLSGGYVDSYDSTQGAYAGAHGSNVSVGTNATANGAINLSGGAADYGDAYVGPAGDPARAITTSGGARIYGAKDSLSMPRDMTPASDPGGGTPAAFTNGTTLASGTYRVSSISLSGGGRGTINGNVTLYVTGNLNLSGQSQIVIMPGGSLTIYLNGSLNVSGGSIVNETLNPHNLAIYGTSTCTRATYSGNSVFYGVIYAPAAKTTVSGGDFYGSVIGSSVTISGGAAVHYDDSLGRIGL